jgi:hypothetical protein
MEATVKHGARILALYAALASNACGGSETAMPIDSSITKIALTAVSTDESAVAVRSDSAALSVEEAGLSLRELEIMPCSSDAASIGTRDYPVDLAFDPPALASFESGVSDYCGMRLAIAPSPADDPPELASLGLYVRGTRSDGLAFEIRSTLSLDVELLASSGAAFGQHLAVGFDLAAWFAGVDVDGASPTDGVVLIDASSNTDVLSAFEANSASAVALYVDADRDGVLDADELEPIATSAE